MSRSEEIPMREKFDSLIRVTAFLTIFVFSCYAVGHQHIPPADIVVVSVHVPIPIMPPARKKQARVLQSDAVIEMAAIMWGEARGEGRLGMRAVGHVIVNRASAPGSKFGVGITGVIKKKNLVKVVSQTGSGTVVSQKVIHQFSVLNEGDPNREKVLSVVDRYGRKARVDKKFVIAVGLAKKIISGDDVDPTGGAKFFYTSNDTPSRGDYVKIGNHIFY